MDCCDVGSARIVYKVFGEGKKAIVVDTALGSCSAEWWHIAEALGKDYKVLVYDRAGYGESSLSSLSRTPENIVAELHKLLSYVGIDKDFTLVGHSQGGLYAVQYALTFPGKVNGLVLLDPATPFDNVFKQKLTDEEFKKSGVDKTMSHKIGYVLTSLGLGFALKPLLKKSPPFFYYPFNEDAQKYLLKSLCRRSSYKTALDEYASSHNDTDTAAVVRAVETSSLGNIPVKVITHSSAFYVEELKYYGSMDGQMAEKIENLWQDIMKRYLDLSSNTEHITAGKSGHFIHLTDFEVVKGAIESI